MTLYLKVFLTLIVSASFLLQGCAQSKDVSSQTESFGAQKKVELISKNQPSQQKDEDSQETQKGSKDTSAAEEKAPMATPAPDSKPAPKEADETAAPDIQQQRTTETIESEQKQSSANRSNEELNSKKQDSYLPEYNPDVRAPKKLNHPLQESNDMTFMLGEDNKGYYLYGEGAIVEGAYKKFKSYVEFYAAKNIKLGRLMMHSPGGLVNEGLAIGSYLRKNEWTTDADKYMQCYSSCGFIYAGGVKKRIQAGAKVGYHRPYIPNLPDTEQFKRKVYQDYQPYWNSVDGDPKLYDKFMKNYGRDEMYILTTDNISQYMQVEQY